MSDELREEPGTETEAAWPVASPYGAPEPEQEPEAPPPPPPRDPTQDEDPTYRVESWSGLMRYVCLICEHEDWSLETLEQHMAVYHRGVMREAPVASDTDVGDEEAVPEDESPQEEEGQPV